MASTEMKAGIQSRKAATFSILVIPTWEFSKLILTSGYQSKPLHLVSAQHHPSPRMLILGCSVTAGQRGGPMMVEPGMLLPPGAVQAEGGQRAEVGAGSIHLIPFNKT